MKCMICNYPTKDKLCKKHSDTYMWDSAIQGFRLKKKGNGSRYTDSAYHRTETKLVKLIEKIFKKPNVVTSFRPIWAVSKKNVLLEYDIYVPKYKLLIEYNGEQHYERSSLFHKTKSKFNAQVRRDKRKAKLAADNGFNLLVVRYDEPIIYNYILMKVRKFTNGNKNRTRTL